MPVVVPATPMMRTVTTVMIAVIMTVMVARLAARRAMPFMSAPTVAGMSTLVVPATVFSVGRIPVAMMAVMRLGMSAMTFMIAMLCVFVATFGAAVMCLGIPAMASLAVPMMRRLTVPAMAFLAVSMMLCRAMSPALAATVLGLGTPMMGGARMRGRSVRTFGLAVPASGTLRMRAFPLFPGARTGTTTVFGLARLATRGRTMCAFTVGTGAPPFLAATIALLTGPGPIATPFLVLRAYGGAGRDQAPKRDDGRDARRPPGDAHARSSVELGDRR